MKASLLQIFPLSWKFHYSTAEMMLLFVLKHREILFNNYSAPLSLEDKIHLTGSYVGKYLFLLGPILFNNFINDPEKRENAVLAII